MNGFLCVSIANFTLWQVIEWLHIALLQKVQREGDLCLSGRVLQLEELLILPQGNGPDEAV